MTKGTITPLTHQLAEAFYGSPPEKTMRGFAYVENGTPHIVFGLYNDDTRNVAFSSASPEFRTRLDSVSARRAVVSSARALIALMRTSMLPIHAIPDAAVGKAPSFLERLGFAHIDKGVYEWRQQQ